MVGLSKADVHAQRSIGQRGLVSELASSTGSGMLLEKWFSAKQDFEPMASFVENIIYQDCSVHLPVCAAQRP